MKRTILALLLCVPLLSQVATPEINRQLTELSKTLSTITFDPKKSITVEAPAAIIAWPEGTSGMLVVETKAGERYAFSTAGVPAMAKQGFTRFSVKPGMPLKITGLLASGVGKVGQGWIAGRAHTVANSEGKVLFDRAKLAN